LSKNQFHSVEFLHDILAAIERFVDVNGLGEFSSASRSLREILLKRKERVLAANELQALETI
jgi:hypothetical protein